MTDLIGKGIPASRACALAGLPRRTWYYERRPRSPRPFDPTVRRAVLDVALERPSFGYRRGTAMCRRRLRVAVNEKRVRRILKAERLQLEPCVVPRARVRKHPGRQITERPDVAWQMDLKYVWCGRDGWAYLQNVVECCTAEWLGYTFGKRCGAREANALLDRAVQERFPETCLAPATRLRVDNGPAYRSDAFLERARLLGLCVEHIQVQTPEDNGVVESFHAGLARDYLNALVFDSFADAEAYVAWAFEDYNGVKPMQRLRWRTPREYHQEVTASAK
ncbi:MAG: IS3 family transposase [Candidatus Thermoplasmatota archaeon]